MDYLSGGKRGMLGSSEPGFHRSVSKRSKTKNAVRASALLVGVAGTLLAPVVSTTAGAATAKKTPVQIGKAYFSGKTIILQNSVGNEGSAQDLVARAVGPYIASYLHATVIYTYVGANAQAQADIIAAAQPTGLMVGISSNSLAFVYQDLTGTSALNFNPERESFLATGGLANDVMMAQPSSGLTTFAAIKSAPAGKVYLNIAGGGIMAVSALFSNLLKLNWSFLTPFTSTPTLIQGFENNDGPLTMTGIQSTGPVIKAGKAIAVATTVKTPVGTEYRSYVDKTPTFAQILSKYLPSKLSKLQQEEKTALLSFIQDTGTFLWTQSKVPSARVLALRDAFAYAFLHAKTALLAAGQPDGYVSGAQAKINYIDSLKAGKPFTALLKSTL